jgi:hypothetical protein
MGNGFWWGPGKATEVGEEPAGYAGVEDGGDMAKSAAAAGHASRSSSNAQSIGSPPTHQRLRMSRVGCRR